MVGCCHWLLTLYFYHIQETGHVLWSEFNFCFIKMAEFLLWCKDFCLFLFRLDG